MLFILFFLFQLTIQSNYALHRKGHFLLKRKLDGTSLILTEKLNEYRISFVWLFKS